MNSGLSGLLYGAIGGGIIAVLLKFIEAYWIDFRLGERLKARQKLRHYAKPLWLDCRELRFRLEHLAEKHRLANPIEALETLALIPREHAKTLEWYTKEGYYVTSTAYLVASVACWIRLFQRDVVFLQFGKTSSTTEFFHLIEKLKQAISKPPSLLWYLYFNGIGEQLISGDGRYPLTTAQFAIKLHTDGLFSEYYDQLFQFLKELTKPLNISIIDEVNTTLQDLQLYLERHGSVPAIINAPQNRTQHVRTR